jgi:hypothetical protein
VRFQKQDLLTSKRSFFSESVRGNRLSTVLGASDIVCPCVILDRGASSYRASEIYAYARAWNVAYSNPIPLAEFVGLDCLQKILQRQGISASYLHGTGCLLSLSGVWSGFAHL